MVARAYHLEQPLEGQIPFDDGAKELLDAAVRESEALGADRVGSGHLALACTVIGAVRDLLDGHGAEIREYLLAERQGELPRILTVVEPMAVDAPPGRREGVPTHHDRPADFDVLDRAGLAEVLADRIRWMRAAEHDHAILVHLSARWGAGKSTIMRFLRDELERPRDAVAQWVVVDFNAWQHQRVAPPWWWLLSAIRREGSRQLRRRSLRRWAVFNLRDFAWRMWNARPAVIAAVLLAALAVVTWRTDLFGLDDRSLKTVKAVVATASAVIALGVTVTGLMTGFGRWVTFGGAPPGSRLLERAHDPMRASQRRFRFLIDALREPVAIMVDDLDRCSSAYVVELLEGIQTLFLDRPVAYVVAADRSWLSTSFEAVYEDFGATVVEPGRPLGYLFLEKTFQISLDVPNLTPEVRDRLWDQLLGGSKWQLSVPEGGEYLNFGGPESDSDRWSEEDIEQVLRAAGIGTPNEAQTLRRAAARRLNSPELATDLEHALEAYAHLLENNPRAMKRLVNAYGIERALQARLGMIPTPSERVQNVLWAILRLRWPTLGEALARRPADVRWFAESGAAGRPPAALADLGESADVRAVIRGDGFDVGLDEEAIGRLTGLASGTSSSIGA